MHTLNNTRGLLIALAAASLSAGSAVAAPVTWSGTGGLSMLNNPTNLTAQSDIASVLAPQNTLISTHASNKQASAAASSSAFTSEAQLATEITDQVLSSSAQNFITESQTANTTGTLGAGNSTITYDNSGTQITYTIYNPGQSPFTVTIPIQ